MLLTCLEWAAHRTADGTEQPRVCEGVIAGSGSLPQPTQVSRAAAVTTAVNRTGSLLGGLPWNVDLPQLLYHASCSYINHPCHCLSTCHSLAALKPCKNKYHARSLGLTGGPLPGTVALEVRVLCVKVTGPAPGTVLAPVRRSDGKVCTWARPSPSKETKTHTSVPRIDKDGDETAQPPSSGSSLILRPGKVQAELGGGGVGRDEAQQTEKQKSQSGRRPLQTPLSLQPALLCYCFALFSFF